MSEKDLKLTDLDYATGDHHLQMMKAALPYLDIRRQRSLSMFIRAREPLSYLFCVQKFLPFFIAIYINFISHILKFLLLLSKKLSTHFLEDH